MTQLSNYSNYRPQNVHEFYQKLSIDVRQMFREESMVTLDWGRSTFYDRVLGRKMKKSENKRFMKIVNRYAKNNNIKLNF